MNFRYKYGNKKCRYGNRIYHSRLEAGGAMWLDLLLKQGKIAEVKPQCRLDVRHNGKHIYNMIPDFRVTLNDGRIKYAECKGFPTREWVLQVKVLRAIMPEIVYLVNPNEKELLE